uniref:Uncharacterized protein n=1 Tax=Rhizophora mucronata TaxID=61149 RepID=A0A2P2QYS5_RHIMU
MVLIYFDVKVPQAQSTDGKYIPQKFLLIVGHICL